jgi:hypothetical protein
MSRLVMKPITDLWWRYCRTNRENLCTFSGIEICFSQVKD